MSYEYNPESSRFNLPNPHAVENLFLGAIVLIAAVGGIISVIGAREALLAGSGEAAALRALAGAALLGFAVTIGIRMMKQLNFFFGRDQPVGYWDDISLKECVRQNAIGFITPKAPIDQLLYRLAPSLVFSPRRVQIMARARFADWSNLLAVSICYLTAMISTTDAAVATWVHAIFSALIAYFILLPALPGSTGGEIKPKALITILIASIVGPIVTVAAGVELPRLDVGISFVKLNIIAIALSLVFVVLFLVALLKMMMRPDSISSTNSMVRLRMNAHPRQLLVEFDRLLQDRWTEKIPNRVYERIEPKVAGEAGAFKGSVFEESQPVPVDSRPVTLAFALQDIRYRFLVILDIVAVMAVFAGVYLLASSAAIESITSMMGGAIFVVLAGIALKSSNFMWRRFEYHSRAYWLQIDGNFSASKMDLGRQLDDRIRSQKTVINIEDMTLRVWVADLYSTNFDVNDGRDLIGMVGVHDQAEAIQQILSQFAEDQRVFVAPTSARDNAAINQVNMATPLPGSQQAPAPAPAIDADDRRQVGLINQDPSSSD